jgi:hypothetical protein
MKRKIILTTILFATVRITLAEPVTKQNWVAHPKIKEIRSIYNNTVERIHRSIYSKQSQYCGNPDAVVFVSGNLYRDSNGVVRKYELEGGSDDSTAKAEYFYSQAGNIRFSFKVRGAVNGHHSETRTYFEEDGTEIYSDYRLLSEHGYPEAFPKFIKDPANHFNQLCDQY